MKALSRFRTLRPYVMAFEGEPPHDALDRIADPFDPDPRLTGFQAIDPSGQQWQSVGIEPINGELVIDIDGAGHLFLIRIAKRGLPARVIKDRVDEMAKEIYEQTGRKPGRKERQDFASDAEMELLPRAFINNAIVPVIVTSDNRLFIFASAQGRIDTVTSFLAGFLTEFGIAFALHHPDHGIEHTLAGWMTGKAMSIQSSDNTGIEPTDFAVMKGDDEEGSTIRVTNRDLTYQHLQDVLKAGYRVHQIGLLHEASFIRFRLDEHFTLKQITFSDDAVLELIEGGKDEGFDENRAVCWLIVTEMRRVIDDLVLDMNGRGPADDDEDEL
jgi:recombination associated protein RdgC